MCNFSLGIYIYRFFDNIERNGMTFMQELNLEACWEIQK